MLNYSKIETLLKEIKMTQSNMAEKLGMSREGYGRMIRDKTMKVSILERVAEILNVRITYLFDENTATTDKDTVVSENKIIELLNGTISSKNETIYSQKETIKSINIILETKETIINNKENVIEKFKTENKELRIALGQSGTLGVRDKSEKVK